VFYFGQSPWKAKIRSKNNRFHPLHWYGANYIHLLSGGIMKRMLTKNIVSIPRNTRRNGRTIWDVNIKIRICKSRYTIIFRDFVDQFSVVRNIKARIKDTDTLISNIEPGIQSKNMFSPEESNSVHPSFRLYFYQD
jgi:hypothetical protein